jgi:hypothetical protein
VGKFRATKYPHPSNKNQQLSWQQQPAVSNKNQLSVTTSCQQQKPVVSNNQL